MPDVTLQGYFGEDFSDTRCELIAAERIKPDLLTREPGLYRTKWFDYRPLHHVVATYQCAEFYRQAVAEAIRRHHDLHEGLAHRGLKGTDPLGNTYTRTRKGVAEEIVKKGGFKTANELWKMRQAIDATGIPYGFYIRAAMDFLFRNGHWSYQPQPAHVAHPEMTEIVKAAWDDMSAARLYYAETPFFKNENYVGHPDQDAHHAYLVAQVRRRGRRDATLATLVFDQAVLPAAVAEREFGSETVEAARQYASLG